MTMVPGSEGSPAWISIKDCNYRNEGDVYTWLSHEDFNCGYAWPDAMDHAYFTGLPDNGGFSKSF